LQYISYIRLEYVLIVAAVVLAYRAARLERRNRWLWAGLALALCVASQWAPLPYMRVLIATVIFFVIMMLANYSRQG
jgi:chromate transport protein ChrA